MANFTVQISHTHNCCAAYAYNERTKAKDPNTQKIYSYTSDAEDLVSSKTYLTSIAQIYHPEWENGANMWSEIAAFEGTSYRPSAKKITEQQGQMIIDKLGNAAVPPELKDHHYIRQGIKAMIAVPRGIDTKEAQQEFIDDLGRLLTDMGMCCTISLHHKIASDGKPNDHIHVLGSARPLDNEGNFAKYKHKKIYKLDEKGEKIPIYEMEQVLDEKGKPKFENGRPVMVPKLDEKGEKIQKRGDRGRKLFERTTVEQTPWDTRGWVVEFRQKCEQLMNKHLEKYTLDRVNCTSARHRDEHKIVAVHEGYGDATKYKIKGHYVKLNEKIDDRQKALDLRLKAKIIDKEGVQNDRTDADRDVTDFLSGIAAAERENIGATENEQRFETTTFRIAAQIDGTERIIGAAARSEAVARREQEDTERLLAAVDEIQHAAERERTAANEPKHSKSNDSDFEIGM